MDPEVDFFEYHDLTKRLAAFATNGGAHLRGDSKFLVIRDTEPVYQGDEAERARIAGVLKLIGSRSTSSSDRPSLGVVFEGFGIVIVTTQRLICMLQRGASQLGSVSTSEVHTFVLPLDLVDSIQIPERRSFADRLAGSRTVSVFNNSVVMSLSIDTVKKAQVGGREVRVADTDVMEILVNAAVEHRLPLVPGERERLTAVKSGRYERDHGDLVAWITSPDTKDVPAHLIGRLVTRDDAHAGPERSESRHDPMTQEPAAPPSRSRAPAEGMPRSDAAPSGASSCEQCGKPLQTSWKYCGGCGAPAVGTQA